MLQRVVRLAAPKTEEKHGDQFPGQVTDRGVSGHAALAQTLVIGGKGSGLLSRRDQLHSRADWKP